MRMIVFFSPPLGPTSSAFTLLTTTIPITQCQPTLIKLIKRYFFPPFENTRTQSNHVASIFRIWLVILNSYLFFSGQFHESIVSFLVKLECFFCIGIKIFLHHQKMTTLAEAYFVPDGVHYLLVKELFLQKNTPHKFNRKIMQTRNNYFFQHKKILERKSQSTASIFCQL